MIPESIDFVAAAVEQGGCKAEESHGAILDYFILTFLEYIYFV